MMDITNVAKCIIVVLAAIWTYFLLPWLQTKKTAAEREVLADTIKTAVKAAQQMYRADQGTEKKAYVLNWLRAQGFKLDDTAIFEMIDAMIESSVLDLKKEA